MTAKICRIERANFLRYWVEKGCFPPLSSWTHFSECSDCADWRDKTLATIGHIALTLSEPEQKVLVAGVLRKISLISATEPPKPFWKDWALPLFLSSAAFGFAAAALFLEYQPWLIRFSSFYYISAMGDLKFISGIALMWILTFSAALWVTVTLMFQQRWVQATRNSTPKFEGGKSQ